jgi:hypothetical protein
MYSVKKHGAGWAILADEAIVMLFDSYDEALEVACAAAEVMATRALDVPAPSRPPRASSPHSRLPARAWRA